MRGQAEIIGALLLVAIVMVLWSLFWIWFYPQYEAYRGSVTRAREEAVRSLKENIVIEILVYNGDTTGKVYISNLGGVETTVYSVYLNNTLVWDGEAKLRVGEGTWINFNWINVPDPYNKVYYVKVCTLYSCYEVVENI